MRATRRTVLGWLLAGCLSPVLPKVESSAAVDGSIKGAHWTQVIWDDPMVMEVKKYKIGCKISPEVFEMARMGEEFGRARQEVVMRDVVDRMDRLWP